MGTAAALAATAPKARLNFKLNPPVPAVVEEVASLLDVRTASRAVRSGQEIISEGRRCAAVFILVEGVAIRYRVLRDGQRQILSIILPGDFLGAPSCFFGTALCSIRTLTPATVLPLPIHRLVGLFDTHPRIAASFFWAFSCETAIYAERLISISRRPAMERVAHFLLELYTRLAQRGMAEHHSYRLPLTQEIISDVLGLSIPYVNRVLQQLRAEGLVHIKDQEVVIDDMDELSAFADFEPTYLTPLRVADFALEAG